MSDQENANAAPTTALDDNNTQLEELLQDYNGYDFCSDKNCNGQRKANELMANLTAWNKAQVDKAVVEAQLQILANVWTNFNYEIAKRDLSSDVMPKGARKMTSKEILATVISQQQPDLSALQNKQEEQL